MMQFDRAEIKRLKGYSEKAQSTAKKLKAFSDNARKLEKEGKTLNALQDVAKDLRGLSQVGAALGGVAAGLQLVLAFMPGEDAEHQILDGITQLKAQIDGLTTIVETGLDQLKLGQKITSEQAALLGRLADIDAAYELIRQIAEHRKTGKDVTGLIDNLMDYKRGSFESTIHEIRNVMVGTEGNSSLLEAIYDQSYGNSLDVARVSEYLLCHMHTCVILVGAISNEMARREAGGKPSAEKIAQTTEDAAERLDDTVKAASQFATEVLDRCLNPKHVKENVMRFYTDTKPHMHISHKDYRGSAKRVAEKMQGQWSYLKFTAIVYKAVRGYDNHYFHTSDSYKYFRFFETDDETGKKVNVVVFWSGRTTKEERAVCINDDFVPYREGPRNPPQFASGWVLEDIYGPPLLPESRGMASVDPELRKQRAYLVKNLAWRLNREARVQAARDGHSTEPWKVRDGINTFLAPFIEQNKELLGTTPYLLWCGVLSRKDFAVGGSNAGLLVHEDSVFLVSAYDPDVKKFRDEHAAHNGNLYGTFPRLAIFWGDT